MWHKDKWRKKGDCKAPIPRSGNGLLATLEIKRKKMDYAGIFFLTYAKILITKLCGKMQLIHQTRT